MLRCSAKWVEELQTQRAAIHASLVKGVVPNASVLLREAFAAAQADLNDEALRLVEDVVNEYPLDALGWFYKGLIHSCRSEDKAEAVCLAKATELDPNDMNYRGSYGTALYKLKRYSEAIIIMRQALSLQPKLTYLHSCLADAFMALNNYDEMQKELEHSHLHAIQKAARSPDDISAWEEVTRTATRLGNYDEAEKSDERIRELKRDRNLLASPSHG